MAPTPQLHKLGPFWVTDLPVDGSVTTLLLLSLEEPESAVPGLSTADSFLPWNAAATLVKSWLAPNCLLLDSVLFIRVSVCPGDRTMLL